MDLDVRDLELLEALGEHGTLTAASEQLHVSQPALSQRLARIEQRLGTPLFERRNRRLVPNRAGQRMFKAAGSALAELRVAAADVRELREGRRAPIRISSQCTTNYEWLTPIVSSFRQQLPGAEVRVVATGDEDLIGALLRDEIDVALVSKLQRVMDQVRLQRLFDDELMVLVAPGHPWAGRSDVRADEFSQARVVLFASYSRALEPPVPLPLPPGAHPAQLHTPPVTADLLVEMVASGTAVTVMPSWIARAYVEAGTVVPVGLEAGSQRRTWYCATRHQEPSEAVEYFVEILTGKLSTVMA